MRDTIRSDAGDLEQLLLHFLCLLQSQLFDTVIGSGLQQLLFQSFSTMAASHCVWPARPPGLAGWLVVRIAFIQSRLGN